MPFYQLHREQKIPAALEEVWDFISSPKNLEAITPDGMSFETTNQVPEKMYAGMIISYKVSPLLGIKMTWVTEITHVEENAYFVDEQRIGPFTLWHHEHILEPIEGGVLMRDIVSYKPPMGFLGAIANAMVIKRQLNTIFSFRHKAVQQRFGAWK